MFSVEHPRCYSVYPKYNHVTREPRIRRRYHVNYNVPHKFRCNKDVSPRQQFSKL